MFLDLSIFFINVEGHEISINLSQLKKFFILISLVYCIIELRIIYKIIINSVKSTFLTQIYLIVINYFVYQPLKGITQTLLTNKIVLHLLHTFKYLLFIIFYDYKTSLGLIAGINLYHRILVGVALACDLFIYNRIVIFYSYLYILVLPLMFTLIISLYKDYCKSLLEQMLKENLIVTEHSNFFKLYPRNEGSKENLAYYTLEFKVDYKIVELYSMSMYVKNSKYFLYSRLIVVTCFLILWFKYLLIIYPLNQSYSYRASAEFLLNYLFYLLWP